MLVAMAGLPGTGKSSLARSIAAALGGVVLDKDVVRSALFPPPALDYTSAQDDASMAAIYRAAALIRTTSPQITVIIDGRTFSRAYQIADLLAVAESLGEAVRIVECVCSDEVARQRLEHAIATGDHPAKNRTYALYLEVKARANPLTVPRLVVDTGALSANECLARALAYLRQTDPSS
ncbi:hypothetical protein FRUB_07447 [Fimbriiglobus ruber]|uniref:ATP-binding protein n=1 Tax=Fimbriiglobus ruber TaxID=1908690 RepID=A0A225DQ43_9BACT|nr:hypothetical protein FRUB_07447 [Fimbriiglobus ruber]